MIDLLIHYPFSDLVIDVVPLTNLVAEACYQSPFFIQWEVGFPCFFDLMDKLVVELDKFPRLVNKVND